MKSHSLLLLPILFLCATTLLFSRCDTASGSSSSNASSSSTVSVKMQIGTLMAGTVGSVRFAVDTTNLADATPGSIAWYSASDGKTVESTPSGITATVTVVPNNFATVTITTTTAASAGSYYFTVTGGTVTSTLGTPTITAPIAFTYPTSGATITTSSFTETGTYSTTTDPTKKIVCFGGTNDVIATIDTTAKTWSANIDASKLANGIKESYYRNNLE